MTERDSYWLRVKKLVAQDEEINDSQLKEFRMELEQALDSWEQKSQRTRRRIFFAIAGYLAGMTICRFLMVLWTRAAPDHVSAIIRGLIYWPFLIGTLAAALVGVWLVALYFFKYAPRLNRARFDLHTSMLLELQQQVKELHENMEQRRQ
jgi:hypothetical protein